METSSTAASKSRSSKRRARSLAGSQLHSSQIHWDIVKVGDICLSAIDGPFGSKLKTEHYSQEGVRVIRLQNIGQGTFIDTDQAFITREYAETLSSYAVMPGDLLIASLGDDRLPAGRCAVAPPEIAPAIIKADCFRLRPDTTKVDVRFLSLYLNSPGARESIDRRSHGQTRLRLNLANVRQLEVPLPSLEEQVAIADFVSTFDARIAVTVELIARARRSREALQQDLLTRGLPSRNTDFHVVQLGDAFIPRKEAGVPGLPLVAVTMHNGLVDRNEIERRMETNLTDEQHQLVRKNDIAYNMMRMWQGVFGYAHYDCLVSPAYVVVQPTGLIRSDFASHLFKLPEVVHKFHLYSQGLTDDRLRLYYEQFAPIRVKVPKSVEDQRHINRLLGSIDVRIEAQLSELEQLHATKAAAVQELLTGHIRVRGKGGQ